jgi:hypothetical protein
MMRVRGDSGGLVAERRDERREGLCNRIPCVKIAGGKRIGAGNRTHGRGGGVLVGERPEHPFAHQLETRHLVTGDLIVVSMEPSQGLAQLGDASSDTVGFSEGRRFTLAHKPLLERRRRRAVIFSSLSAYHKILEPGGVRFPAFITR